ncbi:MAG: MATE family efflux transporter [Shimia sp.]
MSSIAQYRPEAKALLTLGLPLAGSNVAQVALGATDTLMVGWYGVTELAALTIGGAFFFVLFLAISGFAWAATPMIAEAVEAGDERRVRRVTRMAFWLVTIGGTLAFVPLWFARPILEAAGQTPEVARIAQDYLRVVVFAIYPALWVMVMKSYLSALEHTGVVLWATLIAIPLNVAVNWVLIFGNLGAPELGVRGAAVATVLVNALTLAVLIGYGRRHFPGHALFERLWRPDGEVLGQVFRLGWPIGLTSVSETGLFAGAALLMGVIGTVELAAHGIAMQLASLTFVLHLGLSQAATVRAGRAYGRRARPDLERVGRVSIGLSVAMALATMAVFLTVPAPLVALYLAPDEPAREAVLALGVTLLAMAALFQLMDGAQVTALGLLRGLQDTQKPMWIAAFSYWGVGIPLSWLLGIRLGLGAVGVWAGLVIGLAFAGGLLMWRFWATLVPSIRPRAPA